MKTKNNTEWNWKTGVFNGATHIVDDGGMLYWISAPGKTNDEVAAAFASTYDGNLGEYDVTDIASGDRQDYADYGTLKDYASGETIRPATQAEQEASREAERSNIGGGTGAIEVDGRTVYVED